LVLFITPPHHSLLFYEQLYNSTNANVTPILSFSLLLLFSFSGLVTISFSSLTTTNQPSAHTKSKPNTLPIVGTRMFCHLEEVRLDEEVVADSVLSATTTFT
jgi:hypothetical protein